MPTTYDSPWKEALDIYFDPFVAFFFAPTHAEIDWSRGYETLDKELQRIAPRSPTGARTVDKLMKVWRRDGREEWILIHVEVQSQEDPEFLVRMYSYHYRTFDRYSRTVVSLAVLGDDRVGWRPDRFGYSLWGCHVDFRFPIVKLLDYAERTEELERDRNPFAAVVLAHLKAMETQQDDEARRVWKVRLITGLYDRGFDREDIRQLFRLIDWFMRLPDELEKKVCSEIERFEEARKMTYVTSIERIGIKKGEKRGEKRGERKGLLQGIEIGLKLRFGSKGDRLLNELRTLEDCTLLAEILQRIPDAKTTAELRQLARKVGG